MTRAQRDEGLWSGLLQKLRDRMLQVPTVWQTILWPLAIFVVCSVLPNTARAGAGEKGVSASRTDYGVVAIDLRPERGDVPSHLCVVSEVKGPRTREKLSDLLIDEAVGEDFIRRMQLENWQLWPQDDQSNCQHDGACAPEIRLGDGISSENLHMACVSDSLFRQGVRPGEARLAVVLLEHLEGSPPVIDSLRLTGGVATIGIELDLDRVVVAARSLGGHFEAHLRSFHAEVSDKENKILNLPLTPRCAWVAIDAAGARITEAERHGISLRVHERSVSSQACLGDLSGSTTARVYVPHADLQGSVELDFKGNAARGEALNSYRGQWRGGWPPETLLLTPTRVSFTWRAPECIYPSGVCPHAELASGATCTSIAKSGYCNYVCEDRSDDGVQHEITLPTEVIFEKEGPAQRWTDQLRSPGQQLDSYVETDRRYLVADISQWRLQEPGNRISAIDFVDSEGEVRSYPVLGRQLLRVRIPGASCEAIRYRIVGERDYEEAVAKVDNGRIQLAEPKDTVRSLSFAAYVLQGGGPSFFIGKNDDEAHALVPPNNYAVHLTIAGNLRPARPKLARLSWDLRFGGSVGQWGWYEGVAGTKRREHNIDHRVAWVRVMFGVEQLVDVTGPFTVGLGFDLATSWPMSAADAWLRPTSTLEISPFGSVRIQVYDWLSLVAQGRAGFGERLVRRQTETSEPIEYPTGSISGLFGVRVGL